MYIGTQDDVKKDEASLNNVMLRLRYEGSSIFPCMEKILHSATLHAG
jgi:hypothetical protein